MCYTFTFIDSHFTAKQKEEKKLYKYLILKPNKGA